MFGIVFILFLNNYIEKVERCFFENKSNFQRVKKCGNINWIEQLNIYFYLVLVYGRFENFCLVCCFLVEFLYFL